VFNGQATANERKGQHVGAVGDREGVVLGQPSDPHAKRSAGLRLALADHAAHADDGALEL
jgi:hypothetical protein